MDSLGMDFLHEFAKAVPLRIKTLGFQNHGQFSVVDLMLVGQHGPDFGLVESLLKNATRLR